MKVEELEQREFLRLHEVARIYGVHRSTIWRWIKSKKIPHIRKGKKGSAVYIPVEALFKGGGE